MRQILETEEHVQIPPVMYSDPFYRITYLIKEEIRKYKWIGLDVSLEIGSPDLRIVNAPERSAASTQRQPKRAS
jgi:hypothetical protein